MELSSLTTFDKVPVGSLFLFEFEINWLKSIEYNTSKVPNYSFLPYIGIFEKINEDDYVGKTLFINNTAKKQPISKVKGTCLYNTSVYNVI